MSLPNLLIVGAAKSGTTSLHNYLDQHPDIFMCSPKEPHFLINREIGDTRIPKGIVDEKKYQKLFKGGETLKYRGESSVMYLAYPEIAIKNIKRYLSEDVKVIIMLRNPVERAYSGYLHVRRYNMMEKFSFEEALKFSEERYDEKYDMSPASRYLELGNYYGQVKAYLEEFKNVQIVIYDDYKINVVAEINKVFRFLGVKSIAVDITKEYMVGGWEWKNNTIKRIMRKDSFFKSFIRFLIPFRVIRKYIKSILQKINTREVNNIKPETAEWLKRYYKHDVEQLSILLKRDLNHWTI